MNSKTTVFLHTSLKKHFRGFMSYNNFSIMTLSSLLTKYIALHTFSDQHKHTFLQLVYSAGWKKLKNFLLWCNIIIHETYRTKIAITKICYCVELMFLLICKNTIPHKSISSRQPFCLKHWFINYYKLLS